MVFFFFQAEDGIRDGRVTGVQTCALPICLPLLEGSTEHAHQPVRQELPTDPDQRGRPRPHRHRPQQPSRRDRKSTRLNSSHPSISYAVFCLKKKKNIKTTALTTFSRTNQL